MLTLGKKRSLNTNQLDTFVSNKKLKEELNLEIIFNYIAEDPDINIFDISCYKEKSNLYIELNQYKIKLIENSNIIEIIITDNFNNKILIPEIGYGSNKKIFYNINDLVIEIKRIINCNYNMKCYYCVRFLAKHLLESKFEVLIGAQVTMMIPCYGTMLIVELSYPYKEIGNRGIANGDPELPQIICARILNIHLVRTKLHINRNSYYFSEVWYLKKFIVQLGYSNGSEYNIYPIVHRPIISNNSININFNNNNIKKYTCTKCNYYCKHKSYMLTHELNNHASIKERKEKFKFYCEKCNFGTMIEQIYNNHTSSKKHTNMS